MRNVKMKMKTSTSHSLPFVVKFAFLSLTSLSFLSFHFGLVDCDTTQLSRELPIYSITGQYCNSRLFFPTPCRPGICEFGSGHA